MQLVLPRAPVERRCAARWAIHWNGPKCRFRVLLDDTAIEETCLAIDVERERARAAPQQSKQPPRPRRSGARSG
jgi:hypothetical protein